MNEAYKYLYGKKLHIDWGFFFNCQIIEKSETLTEIINEL